MNEAMLEQAKAKNIYRNTTPVLLGHGVEIPGCSLNSYDAVVMNGAYGMSHMPIDAMFEIARVLKPGLFCFLFLGSELLECYNFRCQFLSLHSTTLLSTLAQNRE